MKYTITIDKEQVNKMPVVSFEGEIIVVDTLSKVNSAVAHLRKLPLVGFDTETRPSFKRGERHPVALLQLGGENLCFLFRMCKIGMPESLKNYLEDASCAKVGLSTHDDFNVMHRSYDFTPAGFIELQEMVKQYNIAELGLQKLYSILFNEKISKGQRLTNWEVAELSPSQQRYAATDAWACLRIYHRLTDGSFDPELSPYKHEITDEET